MYAFGVDLGGTGVKSGIVNERGEIVIKSTIKTDPSHDYRIIMHDIANQLKDLASRADIPMDQIKGVGIGSAGAINSRAGRVDYWSNLNWVEVPVVEELSKYIDLPIKITNDANAAALGETVFGSGKEYHDTIFITLGTGVGGGVIIENKLFEGNESKGTELGHMVIRSGGELCTCGRRGCLEAYASATALIRDTKIAMKKDKTSMMWQFVYGDLDKVDGRTSFECAKMGDYTAKKVVEQYLEYLGEGLCNFINIFRPQAIILGGGICAQGEFLTTPLKRFIRDFSYGGESPKVELLVASLGNDAGLIGGATLVFSGDVDTLR
ncbi:MAG: ROK family glucokinase [Clostridia bacterium]|nr:ROK family glucokinase [Clostridia bacterium]